MGDVITARQEGPRFSLEQTRRIAELAGPATLNRTVDFAKSNLIPKINGETKLSDIGLEFFWRTDTLRPHFESGDKQATQKMVAIRNHISEILKINEAQFTELDPEERDINLLSPDSAFNKYFEEMDQSVYDYWQGRGLSTTLLRNSRPYIARIVLDSFVIAEGLPQAS